MCFFGRYVYCWICTGSGKGLGNTIIVIFGTNVEGFKSPIRTYLNFIIFFLSLYFLWRNLGISSFRSRAYSNCFLFMRQFDELAEWCFKFYQSYVGVKSKMVKLIMIARVLMVLCWWTRYWSWFERCRAASKTLFKKLSRWQNEPSKMSIETGSYVFQYPRITQVCIPCAMKSHQLYSCHAFIRPPFRQYQDHSLKPILDSTPNHNVWLELKHSWTITVGSISSHIHWQCSYYCLRSVWCWMMKVPQHLI